jgi:hypothetical protein
MKRLFLLMVLFVLVVFSYCKKETPQAETEAVKPVIVQMEVVNSAGNSVFYQQQMVR